MIGRRGRLDWESFSLFSLAASLAYSGYPWTRCPRSQTTGPEAAAPGIKAAKALHRKYVAAGDAKAAKVVAETANLFHNITFPEAKADEPKPEKVDSAEVDGQAVDLTGLEDQDAADYAAYSRELDGTARRQRHVEQLEWEDEELARAGGMRHDGS